MKRLAFLLTSAALMTVTAISWSFAQDKVGTGAGTQGFSSISPGNYNPGNNGPGNNGPGNYGAGNYSPGNYNSGVSGVRAGSPFTGVGGGEAPGAPSPAKD